MTAAAPHWRTGWLLYAAFVVYGSLVPLDFHPLPLVQALQSFRATPWLDLGVASRADWVANGVLYAPLGALGALALGRGRPGALAGLASLSLGGLLALSVEFTQQFFPPRTVSLNDLAAEGIGTALGIAVAPFLGGWAARLRDALVRDHGRLLGLGLAAYAVAYLAYGLFPYDLLISRTEWAEKLAGANVGWVVARTDEFSWLRLVLQLVAEAVMVAPLGLWMVERQKARWPAALAAGTLLGLVLEAAQLGLASGVSQGLSVAARAAGAAAGAWAWPLWRAGGHVAVRHWINRQAGLLVWPWLVLLLAASGWGRHPWGGLEQAARAWSEARLQPFYYHYWTTEAAALTSLVSVAAMYAPLAVLAWSRAAAPTAAAVLAMLLALIVESGKLFFADLHPDPTNLLIAAFTVWALVRLSQWRPPVRPSVPLTRAAAPPPIAPPAPAAMSAPPAAMRLVHSRRAQWLAFAPVLVLVAWSASWPATGPLLALLIAGAAAATWVQPLAALVVIPLAVVVDGAPWNGRSFVDEFDLLVAVCAVMATARIAPAALPQRFRASTLVFAAFGACLAIATAIGMAQSMAPWDLNLWWHPHSPLAGLRIAKGALWAWLFGHLYRRLVNGEASRAAWFEAGIAGALVLVVAVVGWERLGFVGNLFDFQADYRVTGPFSQMHKGGAYIECFLALAAAFVLPTALGGRRAMLRLAAMVLLVLGAYAVLVTYSRNGWAAYAWVLACGAVFGLRQRAGARAALAGMAVVVLGVVALAVPVLGGGFGEARLAKTAADLAIRSAHWREALSLRTDGPLTAAFGSGVGRFPERHFWYSQEPRAASLRLVDEEGNRFLRLGTGAALYVEQIVAPPAGQPIDVTLNLRVAGGAAGAPAIRLTLCRKWMLTSSDCEEVEVKGIAHPRLWQTLDVQVPALPPPGSWIEALVPIKLSLVTPAGRAVDVDNIHPRIGANAPPLIANGSFEFGMDHWFYATDLDPPWHIHSLPVALLWDQGWLGLVTGLALTATALAAGARAAWRGSAGGLAALAGFGAFCVSGTLNTLIDEPRFLFLWLALAWLAVHWDRQTEGRRPPRFKPRTDLAEARAD